MAKIIITGGCGYIGSHTIVDLLENGFEVISIDSNVRSSASILENVLAITGVQVKNYVVDLCDLEKLRLVFNEHSDAKGLIHFAALKSVPESVAKPIWYYQNNIGGLINTLQCVGEIGLPNFIFSSSCSVYGNSDELPVTESTPLGLAESPYATGKQMAERIIQDFIIANPNLSAVLLRYFNPGGAHISGLLGENPQVGAYNLVPILMETMLGIRPELTVFGSDYDTRDGTCIRDYIHIMDLADAHTKCLQYLLAGQNEAACEIFNVGIGEGVTVLEAIKATEKAVGKPLPHVLGPRRAGDVVAIYANYNRAAERLGWKPQYSIDDIMASAWAWEQQKNK
jgi:UDP-glucose 4-epimerase